MKTALLATAFMFVSVGALMLTGCSIQRQDRFRLNEKMTVESIKIEPVKKSVYHPERFV